MNTVKVLLANVRVIIMTSFAMVYSRTLTG